MIEKRAIVNNNGFTELLCRYEKNPILTANDWPYPANTVFNPGATILPNGDTLLLARVEDRRGISHLTAARSADGFTDWNVDPSPTLSPDPRRHPEEVWGIEDPRITRVDELGCYVVTYTGFSVSGPLISLALTSDFVEFERKGPIISPPDKDGALFPRRFGGQWMLLHRPSATEPLERSDIWGSLSPDLKHWGEHTIVLQARRGAWWDAQKIGLSVPPIWTDRGWLVIYHGVRLTAAGCLYRIGLALLALKNPRRVLRRGEEWIFGPQAAYEKVGDVGGVVFPCGVTLDAATGNLRIYYGAADSSIAVATANLAELLDWLDLHDSDGGAP